MADKPYKGALLTPMRRRPAINYLAEMVRNPNMDSWSDEPIRREVAEKFQKLALLFEHYEIDQNDPLGFGKLALALAERHVPGFRRMKDRAGPKTKWTEMARAELRVNLDRYIENSLSRNAKRITMREAAKELHTWPAFSKKAASPDALLKQAMLADPRLTAVLRKAANYDELFTQNQLGEGN